MMRRTSTVQWIRIQEVIPNNIMLTYKKIQRFDVDEEFTVPAVWLKTTVVVVLDVLRRWGHVHQRCGDKASYQCAVQPSIGTDKYQYLCRLPEELLR